MFDGPYAEIDSALYLRITSMTSLEKVAIICGTAAVLIGLAVAVGRLMGARRGGNRRCGF
jgi:hypothetical protein